MGSALMKKKCTILVNDVDNGGDHASVKPEGV